MSELESINRALRILYFTKTLFEQNKDKTALQKWEMLKEAHFPEYNLLELMESVDHVRQGRVIKYATQM